MKRKSTSEQPHTYPSSCYRKTSKLVKFFQGSYLCVICFTISLVTANPAWSIQTLRYTSTGPEVKKLQERLASSGFLENNQVDGVFGKKTKAAVIEFQHTQGLSPDGVVGYQTYEILEKQPILAQSFSSNTLPVENPIPLDFVIVAVSTGVAVASASKANASSTPTSSEKTSDEGGTFVIENIDNKFVFKDVIPPETFDIKLECSDSDKKHLKTSNFFQEKQVWKQKS